ncbi:MAG: thioredoxin family protein [Thiobacillaceae bacterium]
MTVPDALICVSGHCPHCPVVLAALAEMVKAGSLGELRVVNVEQRPETARELGVRSVPWVRIGPFELTGLRSRQELESWASKVASKTGMADWFHTLLKEGELNKVLEAVRRQPELLAEVLPIVANPEASLNVRIGAGAVLEAYAGQPALRALLPRLAELSAAADARVRADASYYLGLTGDPAARSHLEARLHDSDAEVREIARESLAALAQ